MALCLYNYYGNYGRGHLLALAWSWALLTTLKRNRHASALVVYIQWTARLIGFLSPHKPPNLVCVCFSELKLITLRYSILLYRPSAGSWYLGAARLNKSFNNN